MDQNYLRSVVLVTRTPYYFIFGEENQNTHITTLRFRHRVIILSKQCLWISDHFFLITLKNQFCLLIILKSMLEAGNKLTTCLFLASPEVMTHIKMVLIFHQHYLYMSLRMFIFVNFHCKCNSFWLFFRFAILDF